MPRARLQKNKGLPVRWQLEHGAYFYRVPPGRESAWDGKKKFSLGRTLPGAYAAYAERIGDLENAKNVGQLFDMYLLRVVPSKAPKTQSGNRAAIVRLRAVFGSLPIKGGIRPQHIYQYVEKRGKKIAAHREVEVLSHAFSKAVQWGLIDRHPFKFEVRLEGEPPRTRLVEDWEIIECLSLKPRRKRGSVLAVQAYIRLKLLTGLAQGDLLRLEPSRQFKDDGIHVTRHKTKNGRATIYEWTDELRTAVEHAKAARPVDLSPWLFCNKRGKGYVNEERGEARGWRSMWQRFLARVLAETAVKERFTEHDLRAKAASDADTLEHARKLLQHADSRLTQRVYRRKPERVKPLK